MLTGFRNIAYVMAYAVATIPLWHYIRDGRILALMVAVVTFAYINVVLSTVQVAQPILSSEKAKTPLPRWLPDKPKYQKWWLLVRRTLKWHLLLIPPKMGLALGSVEYLHSHVMDLNFYSYTSPERAFGEFLMKPYIYLSWWGAFDTSRLFFPKWETIVIATVLGICFTIVGCFLISALVLLITSISKKPHKQMLMLGIVHLTTVLGLVGLIFIFNSYYRSSIWLSNQCNGIDYICTEDERDTNNILRQQQYRRQIRIAETIHVGVAAILDNGILIAANVMRPIGYESGFYDNQNNYVIQS